jgi:hypothetical protein
MRRDVSRRGCSAYTSLKALSELFKNAPRCLHISALEFTAPAVRRRPLAERPRVEGDASLTGALRHAQAS